MSVFRSASFVDEAPRSSLLRRSSHFGYEGRKLRGIQRRRIEMTCGASPWLRRLRLSAYVVFGSAGRFSGFTLSHQPSPPRSLKSTETLNTPNESVIDCSFRKRGASTRCARSRHAHSSISSRSIAPNAAMQASTLHRPRQNRRHHGNPARLPRTPTAGCHIGVNLCVLT